MKTPRGFRCGIVCLGVLGPFPLRGQAAAPPGVPDVVQQADSAEILAAARKAQASFEWERLRSSPLAWTDPSGPCEDLGRICLRGGRDDWRPTPESPRLTERRERLLARLDSAGARLPGDGWILGQRVWYRAEAGRWSDALASARACGGVDPWWCAALEGLALHGLGRYEEASRVFGRALAIMDSSRAAAWRIPSRALDREARDLLEHAPPDSLRPRLRRLWILADPLYLVPGNDRATEHYARRTVAHLREDAHNPYGLSWGSDLQEALVRNGWEVGWERARRSDPLFRQGGAIGHSAPEQRRYLPTGDVLSEPVRAGPTDLEARQTERRSLYSSGALRSEEAPPRSLYAPAYAPVLLPIEAQIAVFPRGDRFIVVATTYLPADTSSGEEGVGAAPPLAPDPFEEDSDRAGLFLVPLGSEGTPLRTVSGHTEARFTLEAPAGRYILSAEAWSPGERRAGRYRAGLEVDPRPRDVAALSDLLLLDSTGPEPHALRDAVGRALVSTTIERGQRIAVAWELTGLGWRPEDVTYRLSVDRRGRGLFGRASRWLHLTGGDPPLSLSWSEPGPSRPGPGFHWLALELPELKPGRYRVRLEARISGRSTLVSTRGFQVEGDAGARARGSGR